MSVGSNLSVVEHLAQGDDRQKRPPDTISDLPVAAWAAENHPAITPDILDRLDRCDLADAPPNPGVTAMPWQRRSHRSRPIKSE